MTTTQEPFPEAAAPSPEGGKANSYDTVPYSINSFPQTRPDRLATIAKLFRLEAAPPDRCRVLELGCASGGNLLPLAASFPGSTFVGIDLSDRQVAEGVAVVRELGLENLSLKGMSILDVGEDFGTFDYILAHGVYSWVPPQVQDKILSICQQRLAPAGVAYISYNTLPGWHARGAIREMLWYHTEQIDDPLERICAARALLDFLADKVGPGDGGYGGLLRQELNVLRQTPDTYILHEHLEEFNEPLYFHQFMERAAAKELQYLGEAQLGTMVAGRFGEEAEKKLREISPDLLHMEQYMDFLRNRMFRQTLLCHARAQLNHALHSDSVRQFYIAAPVKPVSAKPDVTSAAAEEFKSSGAAVLNTRDPILKAVMVHLGEQWPLALSFDKLLAAARARLGNAGTERQAQRSRMHWRLPAALLYHGPGRVFGFGIAFCRHRQQATRGQPLRSPAHARVARSPIFGWKPWRWANHRVWSSATSTAARTRTR